MTKLTSRLAFGVFFTATILFLGSCAKAPNEIDQPGSLTTETTTLYGRITDESGASLQGVSVSASGLTTTTDVNGIFVIKDAKVPKGRAVVIAKKGGYFTGARAVEPGTGGITRMELSMMLNNVTAVVDATVGGSVAAVGGGKIDFSAESFVTVSGSPYTGTVYVTARYLDPTTPTFYNYFSGDNTGRTTANEDVSLISCGVLRVRLTTPTGDELKLAFGKEATITYPKPPSLSAPSSMPLWYFDETIGMWKEEGSATLAGNVYVGKVLHFTDWNMDYKGALSATIKLRVVCNGLPVGGVVVSFASRMFTTSNDGIITVKRVPAADPISIEIRSDLNHGEFFINNPLTKTLTVGQVNDLGDISLNSPCPGTLQGTLVGCGDEGTQGLVTVTYGPFVKYIYSKGPFSLLVGASKLIAINAIDLAGNGAPPIDVAPFASGEVRNIGNVKVCGPQTISYIDITDTIGFDQADKMALSPDGSKLAVICFTRSGSADWAAMIYETATGKKLMEIPLSGNRHNFNSLQFSIDNRRLLIGCYETYGPTEVYEVSGTAGLLLASFPDVSSNFAYSTLSDDGTQVIAQVSLNEFKVKIFSATDGTLLKTLTKGVFSGYMRSMNAVVSAPYDTTCTVWSITDDKEIRSFSTTRASTGYNYTIFSEEGERLVVSSNDYKNWEVYNTTNGTKMGDITVAGQSDSVDIRSAILTKNFLGISENITDGRLINLFNLGDGKIARSFFVDSKMFGNDIAVNRNENVLAAQLYYSIRIYKLK